MKRSHHPISIARAQEIFDAYGVSPERWPEEEREALAELLAHSPNLQRIAAEAALLDGLLDQWQPAPAISTRAVLDAIAIEDAVRTPESGDSPLERLWHFVSGWRRAALALVPLVAGFAWGFSGVTPADDVALQEFYLLNFPLEVLSDD